MQSSSGSEISADQKSPQPKSSVASLKSPQQQSPIVMVNCCQIRHSSNLCTQASMMCKKAVAMRIKHFLSGAIKYRLCMPSYIDIYS